MKRLKDILIKLKPLRGALWLVIFMLAAWWLFVGKDYRFVRITGESMQPTLNNGQWIVVEKPKKNDTFERSDIILLKEEKKYGTMCKRVIGVAGDEIRFGEGVIFINGRELRDGLVKKEWVRLENFICEVILVVPEGCVWVIGDNRKNSWHGLVPIKNVLGKLIL